MNRPNRNLWVWLAFVLAAAVLVRAGMWFTYPVALGNDTPTYQHLALSLRNNGGFDRYNGTRTPGYPIFLLLAGSDSQAYLIQLCLGLLTTLLVFYIAWQVSQRAWFAGLMALTHTLNLGQLFFEGALLSESLATFLLFLALASLAWMLRRGRAAGGTASAGKVGLVALGLGLVSAALALTRPLFAFIPFWGAFFLLFFWHPAALKWRLGAAALAAMPALISLLVWVNFIHTQFNVIGMDSIGGYHLVNHTSSFFELAPDEYAAVRDTFLKFRSQRMAETGSPVNTVWDAIPELMRQTGLNYYALGRLMGTISSGLIRAHPWLYARNLVLGWWWFWRVGFFWLPDTFTSPLPGRLLPGLMLAERLALIGVNFTFLGGSVALLWRGVRRRFNMDLFLWFALSAVWVTSILQTLAEHGDNPRFLAPMQSLVLLVVAGWVFNFFMPKPQLNLTK